MTDRERWTVYPLLFLALGAAMRDKIFDVVNVDNVQCKALLCNALVVADQKGKRQVVISSNEEGGFVRAYGNKNGLKVDLGNTDRLGGLMFIDSAGVHINPGSVYASSAKIRKAQSDEPPQRDAKPGPATIEKPTESGDADSEP